MHDQYGSELDGKVSCIGLHGDYEAGLQMIRDGKLGELRGKYFGSGPDEEAISIASSSPLQESILHRKFGGTERPSPPSTADSEVVQPGDFTSPMPSAITDESSEMSKLGSSGTWSPIDDPAFDASEPTRPLHYLFLGSSLGNFDRQSAAPFLKSLPLKAGDTLLLGLDGRPPPGEEGKRKVEMAYNDPAGHTRAFEEHGWDVVKKEMGIDQGPGVEFVGRYNEEMGRHEAYFRSKGKQTIKLSDREVTLDEGELLNIEWSFKVGAVLLSILPQKRLPPFTGSASGASCPPPFLYPSHLLIPDTPNYSKYTLHQPSILNKMLIYSIPTSKHSSYSIKQTYELSIPGKPPIPNIDFGYLNDHLLCFHDRNWLLPIRRLRG
jgi:hypothetical protein